MAAWIHVSDTYFWIRAKTLRMRIVYAHAYKYIQAGKFDQPEKQEDWDSIAVGLATVELRMDTWVTTERQK